ncbi:uncharacterized protein BX664DRAFT_342128 [Halteromyces radiatus]|uniref:uncharacterized protein n=1 Tax=Halteromyces radiatus TaxID=101107 RepID=UPI00221F2C4A|nr:uncharacterized protein BX664DRAFT_342128 [Halteromyces radiatus]KAI8080032.1 hypothetical protein BX664DRAFT_342128 [Halteromyces radiatus]
MDDDGKYESMEFASVIYKICHIGDSYLIFFSFNQSIITPSFIVKYTVMIKTCSFIFFFFSSLPTGHVVYLFVFCYSYHHHQDIIFFFPTLFILFFFFFFFSCRMILFH